MVIIIQGTQRPVYELWIVPSDNELQSVLENGVGKLLVFARGGVWIQGRSNARHLNQG